VENDHHTIPHSLIRSWTDSCLPNNLNPTLTLLVTRVLLLFYSSQQHFSRNSCKTKVDFSKRVFCCKTPRLTAIYLPAICRAAATTITQILHRQTPRLRKARTTVSLVSPSAVITAVSHRLLLKSANHRIITRLQSCITSWIIISRVNPTIIVWVAAVTPIVINFSRSQSLVSITDKSNRHWAWKVIRWKMQGLAVSAAAVGVFEIIQMLIIRIIECSNSSKMIKWRITPLMS